jgi:hypothetical protein
MNVAQQLTKIGVSIDYHRIIAVLEQVSGRWHLPLRGARVTSADALHEPAQWLVAHLAEHVDVIGHPAVSMDAHAGGFQRIRDEAIEPESIVIGVKNVLAMIATQDDVVIATRDVESGTSRHPCQPNSRRAARELDGATLQGSLAAGYLPRRR